MMDDSKSELQCLAEDARALGLEWLVESLSDWSTEDLIARLQEQGVDTDAERFAVQAREAGRCDALYNRWLVHADKDDYSQSGFLFFAIRELWRRLASDILCPEMLAESLEVEMHQAWGAPSPSERGDLPGLARATRLLMDYLEGLPQDGRDDVLSEIDDVVLFDLRQWLVDSVIILGRSRPDDAIRIVDIMSEIEQPENYQSELAVALAFAGRRDEALERVQFLRERFPGYLWAQTRCGDTLMVLREADEALDAWERALALAEDGRDWDMLRSRMVDLLTEMERPEMWELIRRRHPRPTDRPADTRENMPRRRPSAWLNARRLKEPIVAPKVGRNAPCPCGSGRKFKKCCGT